MTTTLSRSGHESDSRRRDLRAFLVARRAGVSPESVGLPSGARRRTPGLRREEVAVLAGVGVSWYQWLEQGRDITVSPQVLDAVSRVLRLNETERRHLYVLSGLNPPLPWEPTSVTVDLVRLIEGWMPNPAHLLDQYWNLIAANRSAQLVLGYGADEHGNCLESFFLDPIFRTSFRDWDKSARVLAAQYRNAMTEHPNDEGFVTVVDNLRMRSPEFASQWDRHEAEPMSTFTKVIAHPLVGELIFESTQLQVPGRSDLFMVFHDPHSDTDTAEKVDRLLTESAGARQFATA